jgi:hypothetical protein
MSQPNKPSFVVNFENEPEYLRAEVSANHDSYDVTSRYWSRIAEELRNTGHRKLLIVEMIEDNIEIGDAFRAIRERDKGSFQGVKIAFFDIKKDHVPINSFGAAAAAHLGYEIEVFSNIHAAKDWLLAA